MNEQPLVSVIIPAYNAEKWVADSIRSVAAQTWPNWECILVNDGSADGTQAAAESMRGLCGDRLVVLNKPNGGVSSARNAGLAAARGEYVTFVDADDWIHPEELALAMRLQAKSACAAVIWRFTLEKGQIRCSDQVLELSSEGFAFVGVDGLVINPVCNKLFRMDVIRAQGVRFNETFGQVKSYEPEDKRFVQDYLTAARRMGYDRVCLSEAVLYYYHKQNEQSITRQVVRGAAQAEPEPSGPAAVPRPEEGLRQLQKSYELCPELDQLPLEDARLHHFKCLRSLAWSLSAWPPPPGLCRDAALRRHLAWARRTRQYTPYYLPFRLGLPRLAGFLFRLQEKQSRWYGRFDWGFYYLLGGNWNR